MNLYHRPASLFVAEFIGSPKMNLLQGTLLSGDAQHARVDVGGQTLTVAVDARHLQAGESVKVGIRPEHIPLGQDGEGTGVAASLQHIERLGDSSLLYVQIAGQPIATVKVEGSAALATGSELTLRLLPDQLHLFDSQGIACHRTVELPA
jgi:multiple sugar transport system ATP-binding protein